MQKEGESFHSTVPYGVSRSLTRVTPSNTEQGMNWIAVLTRLYDERS